MSCGIAACATNGTAATFETNSALTSAVDEWIVDSAAAYATYGAVIGCWDVSKVDVFSDVFANEQHFDADLSEWDLNSATSTQSMFQGATSFNGDLSKWQTGKVADMSGMFSGAILFNSNVSEWDLNSATSTQSMFQGATSFNGDLSKWQTGKVVDMGGMFHQAYLFNSPINSWDVTNVADMSFLFHKASAFNQDLSKWNVGKANTLRGMFAEAFAFNGSIAKWNTTLVTNMESAFAQARAFNSGIGSWDVSKVFNMKLMFSHASAFNQDISAWDVSAVVDAEGVFKGTRLFDQNIDCWSLQAPLLNPNAVRNGFSESKLESVGKLPCWYGANVCEAPKDNWRFSHDAGIAIELPEAGIKYSGSTTQEACFEGCKKDVRCKQAVFNKLDGGVCYPMSKAFSTDSDNKGGTNSNWISVHCNGLATCPRRRTSFTNNAELKSAVDEWAADRVAAVQKLKPINCWDVSSLNAEDGFASIKELEFSTPNTLVGTILDLAELFPNLEVLKIINQPGLAPGPIWSWLTRFAKLRELRLFNINRNDGHVPDLSHLKDILEVLQIQKISPNRSGNQSVATAAPIPGWLSTFTKLRAVEFCDSNRNGIVPDLSASVPTLTSFGICGNFNMDKAPIPDWISLCTNMVDLWLHGCMRTGTIPDLSGLSKSLKTLHLAENPYMDPAPIPAYFSEFAFERFAAINTNRIGSLPDLSNSADTLSWIDISNNPNLDPGPMPAWTSKLSNLNVGAEYSSFANTNRYGVKDPDQYLNTVAAASRTILVAASDPVVECTAGYEVSYDECKAYAEQSTAAAKSLAWAGALPNGSEWFDRPSGCWYDITRVFFNSLNASSTCSPDRDTRPDSNLAPNDQAECQRFPKLCFEARECTAEYEGDRCQTCKGCKDGLMCGPSANTCMVPPDLVSAYGSTQLRFDWIAANLVGSIPNVCAAYPDLDQLYLHSNPNLNSGPMPSWIVHDCTSLRILDLGNTNRHGSMGAVDLSQLSKSLTRVGLWGNPFDAGPLPSWISMLPKLSICNVDSTQRTGSLNAINFAQFPNLYHFAFSNNPNFDSGPVPDFGSAARPNAFGFDLQNTNRYGATDPSACALGLVKDPTKYQCTCNVGYGGQRCEYEVITTTTTTDTVTTTSVTSTTTVTQSTTTDLVCAEDYKCLYITSTTTATTTTTSTTSTTSTAATTTTTTISTTTATTTSTSATSTTATTTLNKAALIAAYETAEGVRQHFVNGQGKSEKDALLAMLEQSFASEELVAAGFGAGTLEHAGINMLQPQAGSGEEGTSGMAAGSKAAIAVAFIVVIVAAIVGVLWRRKRQQSNLSLHKPGEQANEEEEEEGAGGDPDRRASEGVDAWGAITVETIHNAAFNPSAIVGDAGKEVATSSASSVGGGSTTIAANLPKIREIKREHLRQIGTVGKGQFGEVWKAYLDESPIFGPPSYLVAAKTVAGKNASAAASQELRDEANVMARLASHPNVLA
eukprot:gene15602-10486_t